jgi:hypothetical protein
VDGDCLSGEVAELLRADFNEHGHVSSVQVFRQFTSEVDFGLLLDLVVGPARPVSVLTGRNGVAVANAIIVLIPEVESSLSLVGRQFPQDIGLP